MSDIQDLIYSTTMGAMGQGERQERERITANIWSRVTDLRSCGKNDNCNELADMIESYIPEWTEEQTHD